jgi:molecular chaperone GrpE (heat shock protein)
MTHAPLVSTVSSEGPEGLASAAAVPCTSIGVEPAAADPLGAVGPAVPDRQVSASHVRPEPEDEPLRSMSEGLLKLAGEVTVIRSQSERFHERSQAQEDIISRMQARLEELQSDQVRALLGPVAAQLATLHGELSDVATRRLESLSPAAIAKELSILLQRVESSLELLGMATVGAAAGAPFDRRLHTATRRIPTGDFTLDQTIATVVRQGFGLEGADRATVPARVAVYQYSAEVAPSETPSPETLSPSTESVSLDTSTDFAAHLQPASSVVPDVPQPPAPPGYHEG